MLIKYTPHEHLQPHNSHSAINLRPSIAYLSIQRNDQDLFPDRVSVRDFMETVLLRRIRRSELLGSRFEIAEIDISMNKRSMWGFQYWLRLFPGERPIKYSCFDFNRFN